MLEPLPSRPVARFMLPLADVMTVLFSLFLLLPHLEQQTTAGGSAKATVGGIWSPDEQLQARDELTRLRRLGELPASDRLQVGVLLIDEETGRLVLHEAAQTSTIANGNQLRAIVEQHRGALARGKKLLYILQVPALQPGRTQRRHPISQDFSNYRAWFGAMGAEYQISGLPDSPIGIR